MNQPEPTELMTPSEVARLFRVDPKTVTRWAKSGRQPSIRTLGGHRRYPAAEVYRAFEQGDSDSGGKEAPEHRGPLEPDRLAETGEFLPGASSRLAHLLGVGEPHEPLQASAVAGPRLARRSRSHRSC